MRGLRMLFVPVVVVAYSDMGVTRSGTPRVAYESRVAKRWFSRGYCAGYSATQGLWRGSASRRVLPLHVALRFAYDGEAFDSYARMPGRYTVEDSLMAALASEGYVEGSFKTGSRTDA